jgi:hypothetical protein
MTVQQTKNQVLTAVAVIVLLFAPLITWNFYTLSALAVLTIALAVWHAAPPNKKLK